MRSAQPQPLPLAGGGTSKPQPKAGPSAIADFTTLPPASRCVKGRTLRLKLKKPPKSYTVKSVTVKVNGRRALSLKGKRLKKAVYLRMLPRGTFTVEVAIKLVKGSGLTERRRYTACR